MTGVTLNDHTMTKADHMQWASARVESVEMRVMSPDDDGRTPPSITVEIGYRWKGSRFSKTIHSVMN